MINSKTFRIAIALTCATGLVLVFVFQDIKFASSLEVHNKLTAFFIHRTARFFINDLLAIGLIYALFHERKYTIFSLWVQLAGVVLFLIPYFVLKYYMPNYNGPMINYLHRLILNPTLLLLLIVAFYYQKSLNWRKVTK